MLAAAFTCITSSGRCRYVAISLGYGPRSHPIGRIIKETISEFFLLIQPYLDCAELSRDLFEAWHNINIGKGRGSVDAIC